MCKYFGYFLSVWALGLGTFYAYMLFNIITSIRELSNQVSGPLSAFNSLMGPSSNLDLLNPKPSENKKPIDPAQFDAQSAMIYGLINDNMKDEKKREQYLREFLPGTGLEDRHYKEMNALLKDFKIEKLKEHVEDIIKYVSKSVTNEVVRKKTMEKIDEFKANTADIDEALKRLTTNIIERNEL